MNGTMTENYNLSYEPLEIVSTEGLTYGEWLDYRRTGIGGSDVAALMGQSPFCTARDLYYDKSNIKPVIEENEKGWVAKEVGHRLESLVARIFSKKYDLEVFQIGKMFRHPLCPFMVADVDYFIKFPDGKVGILECKTTNYNCQDKWADESVPLNYEYQCRHYMAVMNLDVTYIACLYGNNENEFVVRRIDRDLDIEQDIIQQERYFWEEHVGKKNPPPYTEESDLVLESLRRHVGSANKSASLVNFSKMEKDYLDRCLALKDEKAQVSAKLKVVEEMYKKETTKVIELLGVSCKGVLEDNGEEYTVTYNPQYRTSIPKEKLAKLKELHPSIYDEFIAVSETRIFRIKKKKIKK